MARKFCEFPNGFLWGTATAAYQVEGAAAVDGRTPSVWDTFSRRPGTIAMDHNGDVATDHYHRFKEDVALMKSYGLKAYRFGVSWSRVIPRRGEVNQKGLDFYRRLVDELRNAGIEPWMTMFHWDLPQWCEDTYRGFESADIAKDFADYATVLAKALGDKVAGVFTINEFMCFLDKGYSDQGEVFAPGKPSTRKVLNQARHHALLAHGHGALAYRAASPKSVPVGLAENIPNIVPILETEADIGAAREALRDMSGMYMTPICEGHYHPNYLVEQGGDAPVFTTEEMKIISTPLDFVGLNLYSPTYIKHDPESPKKWSVVHIGDEYPKMHMPWLNIGPSILYWGPRLVVENWRVPAVYITENGCAYPDKPNAKGDVVDLGRMMYLQNHLIHLHRATADGYPVKGYFLWSMLDNFEWATGYTKRFGITYVNYTTQQRIPKLSAKFYSEVIRRNAVGG